jgi:uptake hydrogenase large subunit
MAIEGELVVRVGTRDGRVTRAQARAERPRVAGRLFAGRHMSEAAPLAGSLFAICGRSQAIAADAAVEAAREVDVSPALSRVRNSRIAAETVHEHVWRLLVDWPKLAGRAPAIEALSGGRKALSPLLAGEEGDDVRGVVEGASAWARESIFGVAPSRFLEHASVGTLHDWTRKAGTPAAAAVGEVLAQDPALGGGNVAFLPAGSTEWVARNLGPALEEEGFDDVPHWRGEPRETGPLARMAHHPLVADAIAAWGHGVGSRLAARLVEAAWTLEGLSRGTVESHGATRLDGASALSWVDTARGLLVHRVTLEGERIARYRIVAPTEWNFHPEGAFTCGALGLAAGDPARLERDVRWLVASLDPCVGVRYEAGHA